MSRHQQVLNRIRAPSRYIQVAVVCALVNNIVVVAFDYAHLHYAFGLITAFVAGNTIGYRLHAGYTFKAKISLRALAKFFAASFVGFCWTMLFMAGLCDGVGLRATVAMPIVTILLFGWNYLTTRWAVLAPAR